ncbi:hypothetical protein MAL08_02875 [Leptospira noguchii]|uniref:hypothetical protein n=1 Tax=Leptospira noguchii TaxID=28182 RepID=UPI001FB67906|nr:hypothetical protein [Leptospira noguchii]UOG38303.1 hypothetical protein MAL08_02875 [Leptospira noguchii]
MERKRTTQRLASRTQQNAFYESVLGRRSGSRCIEFIIRPIFLRRTHVKLRYVRRKKNQVCPEYFYEIMDCI